MTLDQIKHEATQRVIEKTSQCFAELTPIYSDGERDTWLPRMTLSAALIGGYATPEQAQVLEVYAAHRGLGESAMDVAQMTMARMVVYMVPASILSGERDQALRLINDAKDDDAVFAAVDQFNSAIAEYTQR